MQSRQHHPRSARHRRAPRPSHPGRRRRHPVHRQHPPGGRSIQLKLRSHLTAARSVRGHLTVHRAARQNPRRRGNRIYQQPGMPVPGSSRMGWPSAARVHDRRRGWGIRRSGRSGWEFPGEPHQLRLPPIASASHLSRCTLIEQLIPTS